MQTTEPRSFRGRIRRMIVEGSDAVSARLAYGRTLVALEGDTLTHGDYQYHPTPRFGVTAPALPWLVARLEAQAPRLAAALEACAAYAGGLARIPLTAPDASPEPRWDQDWMTGLDGAWLYGMARARAAALYMEIGSGNSTKFVRRAIDDGGLATRIVSIDPCPRAEVDALCDRVHRTPLEETDLTVFDALRPGDILFFDGSHRAFQNSDVTVFFLEVLPRLAKGVLVGVHDIFLPFDYPADWTERLYNEQHVLGAYLLGRESLQIEFAAHWIARSGAFAPAIERLFTADPDRRIPRDGGCFFFVN